MIDKEKHTLKAERRLGHFLATRLLSFSQDAELKRVDWERPEESSSRSGASGQANESALFMFVGSGKQTAIHPEWIEVRYRPQVDGIKEFLRNVDKLRKPRPPRRSDDR